MDERCVVFSELAEQILVGGAYKATEYLSNKLTIKATRKLYKADGRRVNKKDRRVEIVFTIGEPNYEERERIKQDKKYGTLPEIAVKFPPAKSGGKK